ncbi:MAG: carbon-nitrogen hydrolase family protein [bacterium]|nr:carbon-nitrogen hydrolase family protein [bacterium]
MARNLGVAGIQMTVVDEQDNTDAMLKKLNRVASLFPWVDIICFSELCISGPDMSLAMPIPNPSFDRFISWAQKNSKWLIPGSFYEKENDKIYNTALVISPEGEIVARYRKMFPWRPIEESEAGEEFCIFEIPGKGRFGLCICYDVWFPEVTRSLAWMGAEAVFCPTATYTSDRAQEMIMAQANAISNQLYFFNVNGLGVGGIGQSIFVDPEGRVLQTSGESEIIMTEVIDLDHTTRVREYGTMGQCQVWKALADFKGRFPVYQEDIHKGEIFKSIGPLKLHKKIGK